MYVNRYQAATLAACSMLVFAAIGPSAWAAESYGFIGKWGSVGIGDGEFGFTYGVDVDASGNVYVADFSRNRVQKFTSTGTFLSKWGSGGTGDGEFAGPIDVGVDAPGNVYVVEVNNARIQEFDTDGIFVTKWGIGGSPDGEFIEPRGVALDASGNVYVADTGNYRIQKFDSAGVFITKWGAVGSYDGQLNQPMGVAVDGSGNVYVADTWNHRIQKFTSTGTFITKWGSHGAGTGQFSIPNAVAVDASGNVYVADSGNHRIQKFTSTGTFITKWGSLGSGDGQFNEPGGVAVDALGNVYVGDSNNFRIQKFALRAAPELSWLDATGYTSDGVNPDSGDPDSTVFAFKVSYSDADGDAPVKRYVKVQRLDGSQWVVHKVKKLSQVAGGDLVTGMTYRATVTLPNGVYRYRFDFADGDGPATGSPTSNRLGPAITGPPLLSWAGANGYAGQDGVKPNSGPPGTAFRFRVIYSDGDGQAPTARQVEIRRNGNTIDTRDMNPKGGNFTTGKTYQVKVRLKRPNSQYEYRFVFADSSGAATGPPTGWTSGFDTTAGAGPLVVTGLSTTPTNVGAQITFGLASASSVDARVLNLAGRPVKTICHGTALDAGANTLLWNARDNQGLAVPSGAYLVEVVARDDDGGEARAVTPLRLAR